MMRRLPCWPLLALLAACSSAPETPSVPVDEALQREARAGHLAFTQERAKESASHYRAALARAQMRDDIAAIGDLGYNLAVAELRADAPARALTAAQETRAELERRGMAPFPALLLAEATALYRTGSFAAADALAASVQTGGDGEAAARATFLRGLIADETNDAAGLGAAALALGTAGLPPLQADAAELAARAALDQGDVVRAGEAAARAVELRRDTLDYRGLARALALQGEAAQRAGDAAAAADLFLRAGRSAAEQDDPKHARQWLQQALRLAPDGSVARDAHDVLATLDQEDQP
jgi:hypothetical protein